MSVDRSYSPYEVIRAYHDRGMMKWGAFATGELTEAQNTFEKEKKDDKKIQALPHHVVLYLLNQSFSNQLQIKVKYQSKDKLNEVYGFVSEFINNQVRIKSTDKICHGLNLAPFLFHQQLNQFFLDFLFFFRSLKL